MAQVTKIEALVLSRRNEGEADRRLTLFAKEQGVLRVVAKGVRKIPSRRGGHLEPLTKIIGLAHGRPGRSYFLSGVETEEGYPGLRADGQAQEQVRVLNHLLVRVLPEEEPQPQLYARLSKLWAVLPRVAPKSRWLLETGMACDVLRTAGLLPRLGACSDCGQGKASEAVILDAVAGGWRCLTCHSGFSGTMFSVPAEGVELLRLLATDPRQALRLPWREELSRQLVNAMRGYVSQVVESALPVV